MQLTVNGEDRSLPAGSSVSDLVSVLGLDGRKIAVERNLEIVPRSQYGETELENGDRIEIVAFVGGG
ncbi:sulfur carrier protein ThiS [Maricaulis parjimensis]|uniref:sulfur carrier protein ThiS n=1 Tax=Maricaulis parjimensis TaxID=144023 RepID=UPI001939ED74|nr:sulfur carrier protein ThiS [Maricaulis parjimensis]